MRRCPGCLKLTLPIKGLVFGDSRCANCGSLVRVNRVASMGFSVLIFVATVTTTIMVLAQMGLYAALLWFSCPIGALSYVKARLCPLQLEQQNPVP